MTSSRERDVARRRKERREAREVMIPAPADMGRRRELEADDEAWLRYYFAETFWYEFTDQQRQMIAAIRAAILFGGDQALAASRGEGKTTLAERLVLEHALTGAVKFSVLFAATGGLAQDSLASIMSELETNDRLAADYPEVCAAVRALESTPNRAHYVLATGERIDNGEPYKREPARFKWCGHEIILPRVPGSPSAGAIIATRGLDSAVRGLNKFGRRPDLAVIDDPDSEDTANSEELSRKLERRIDRAIAGLGGQKRTVSRVLLGTCASRVSVAYKFTDPEQKPSWHGRRFRFLVTPPTNADLWEQYVQMRRDDWREGTNHAAEFYAEHRVDMDAGAVVANPNRYTPEQTSALQFYYDQVARTDAAAVATEYDNDPPEETGATDDGLTPRTIQTQVSGVPQGIIPPGCVVLTHGVDIGKWKLHWCVIAWRADATGFVIDYGAQDVNDQKLGSDEGLDRAIYRAVLRRMDLFRGAGYATADGQQITDPLTLIDARYRTVAVYAACAQLGMGVYPVMGIGQSPGCVLGSFRDVQRRSQTKRPGDGWFQEAKGRIWLTLVDADRWKAYLHDRWSTARDLAGCMFLYGEPSDRPDRLSPDERMHQQFAEHICAEKEIEEEHKGIIRRRWRPKSKENHWLDASYYACVAANMKGIRALSARVADVSSNGAAPPRRGVVVSAGARSVPRW